jgi:hypothetical protein
LRRTLIHGELPQPAAAQIHGVTAVYDVDGLRPDYDCPGAKTSDEALAKEAWDFTVFKHGDEWVLTYLAGTIVNHIRIPKCPSWDGVCPVATGPR